MNGKTSYLCLLLLVGGVCSYLLRALPFVLFGSGRRPPATVTYLGRVLAPAIIALLVVYCFAGYVRGGCLSSPRHGLAEAAAAVLTVAVHLWRRNPLLSIVAGTALYMALLHWA